MAYDDQDAPEQTAASKGRSPLLLGAAALVVFAVGLGAGVGGVAYLDGEEASAEEAAGATAMGTRSVVNLGMFNINIRGSGGARVLRMEVQLEVEAADTLTFEELTPVLRDGVIALASDYTYADLEGLDGKTHLRDELLGRLNTLIEHVHIERVFFTEFVVQ